MAVRNRRGSPRREAHAGSHLFAWPGAVAAVGSWLRQQSRRPGPVGAAAVVAVAVVNRSACLVGEISAEVMRATADEGTEDAPAAPVRRRAAGPRTRPRTTPMRRPKPEG